MKKLHSKILTLLFLSTFTLQAGIFSSCSGVIFDEIRNEVELDDAVVSGDIQNIIRYNLDDTESVFVSTGIIYYRSVAKNKDINGTVITSENSSTLTAAIDKKTSFKTFSNPSGTVYGLAADSTYLYAISVLIEKDSDEGENLPKTRYLSYYDTASSSWKQIWTESYSSSTVAKLFCTNTPQSANRHAYFRYGSKVFELSGSTAINTSKDAGMTLGENDNTTLPMKTSNSCTTLGSTVYFSTANAMTSNETFDTASTYIYRSSSSSVYYTQDGSSWTGVDLDSGTIQAMTLSSDYLLAGTSSGIVHTPITDYIPKNGTSDFSTNAASTLSSYYEVPAVAVIDPSQTEKTATIFASAITSSTSASLNNVGLWSYFASKGEWNRE